MVLVLPLIILLHLPQIKMKKLITLLSVLLLFGCEKKEPAIDSFTLCMLLTVSVTEEYPGASNVKSIVYKNNTLYANTARLNESFSYSYSNTESSSAIQKIYESSDDGITWKETTKTSSEIFPTITPASSPSVSGESTKLTAFANASIGWAITSSYLSGSGADEQNLYYIKKSADGGKTWTVLKKYSFTKPSPIQIQALDNTRVIVLLSNSSLEYSSDGGTSWTTVNLNPDLNLNQLYFYDLTFGFLIDVGKTKIYSTETMGATIKNTRTADSTVNGFTYKSKNTVFYSAGQNLFISEDGGANWTVRASNIANYTFRDYKFRRTSICQF